MTKMAAMPVYGENLKKDLLLRNQKAETLTLGMQHRVLEYYRVCSNDDPGLTLTYFMARSNLFPYGKTIDFSETIVVNDIKVSRCS